MAQSKDKLKSNTQASTGRQKPRPGIDEQSRLIMEAAVPLFLDKRVKNVSISEICQFSGISRSTFYRCFEHISGLLAYIYGIAVFEPVKQHMLPNLQSSVSQETLKTTLDNMFEAIFEQGQYAELLFRESHDPSSDAFHIVNNAFDTITESLIKSLPRFKDIETDRIYLKSLLFSYQWIAHDTIRKNNASKKNTRKIASNKQSAKDAAWLLLEKALT